MLSNAWAIYRLASRRQRELTEQFAQIGVNFMHLDTKFAKPLLKEAMETDATSVADKYKPLVSSIAAFSGRVVTPEFNRRLLSRFTLLQDAGVDEITNLQSFKDGLRDLAKPDGPS